MDKKQFKIRMKTDTYKKVRALACAEHRSMAMEIEHIINVYMAGYESDHGELRLEDYDEE